MAHFTVSKATKINGKAQTWIASIRRPYVSAIVWDNIEPGLEFATASAAKEHVSRRYGVRMWARHAGRGSAFYTASNDTREALPVYFVEFEGEATAIFPTLCGSNDGDVTCYAHHGQHGTASQEFARTSQRVTIHDCEDARDLLNELRRIYEMGETMRDRVSLYIEQHGFKSWHHNARFDEYHKNRR